MIRILVNKLSMILHLQKVADRRAVRERIWKSNHQKAVLFSVPGSQAFDWLAWWEMAHTNVVSKEEALVTFVPPGTEAATSSTS